MPTITPSQKINSAAGTSDASPHVTNELIVEVKTATGHASIHLERDSFQTDALNKFLRQHGYQDVEPKDVLDKAISSCEPRVRMDRLGFERSTPLELPKIGQAHELEFPRLRARMRTSTNALHGQQFLRSKKLVNGIPKVKIVAETLGKVTDDATTEVVVAPASSKKGYRKILDTVRKFESRITSSKAKETVPINEAFPEEMEIAADALVWHNGTKGTSGPCIHTTRGTPIRAISTVLSEPESRLRPEAKILLEGSAIETDKFVSAFQLHAPREHKLWETINLAIWMAACDGFSEVLENIDENKSLEHNKTLKLWSRFAGKNFMRVVVRFSAGDVMRCRALKASDQTQMENLLLNADWRKNNATMNALIDASSASVQHLLNHLATSKNSEHQEISRIVQSQFDVVKNRIGIDMRHNFTPSPNSTRYPDDTKTSYGLTVNPKSASSSFAYSQFIPRRETLGNGIDTQSPVTGAIEFRASDFAPNARISSMFAKTNKRKERDFDSAWQHFENYVGRLTKKRKTA